MRRFLWATVGATCAVLAVAARETAARPTTYGPTATKACLAAHGVLVNSFGDPATATLTAAERRKLVSAVISPKGGSRPLFLYLALGRDVAEARSLITRVGKHLLEPRPR